MGWRLLRWCSVWSSCGVPDGVGHPMLWSSRRGLLEAQVTFPYVMGWRLLRWCSVWSSCGVPDGVGHPMLWSSRRGLLEAQFSNMSPSMARPMMMGSHVATIMLWFCLALISTKVSHCGYHLPFLPSPEFHDFHQLRCRSYSFSFTLSIIGRNLWRMSLCLILSGLMYFFYSLG
ncbi:uncharacterized protein LOC143765697 isoform X2 [Ranitomeya variabilis]